MTHKVEAIRWSNGVLELLDQRVLPHEEIWHSYTDAAAVAQAIRDMIVRGAPAIGITAAYGVVFAAANAFATAQVGWKQALVDAMNTLAQSRPTAVNLFWALARMQRLIDALPDEHSPESALLEEALAIHEEDYQANLKMGEAGAALIAAECASPIAIMTHCNTGSLATGGHGTALGVIRSLYKKGMLSHVCADETRPWMQGARLTAWELQQEGIPVVLNADAAAAHIMKQGAVKWVIVGADRITANGDAANKIGTYSLAVLARYHGVKFMVVAPSSTVDMSLSQGDEIHIEERTSHEVTHVGGVAMAPDNVVAYNPVFDVTPAALIDAIVTERGVVLNPNTQKMQEMMAG